MKAWTPELLLVEVRSCIQDRGGPEATLEEQKAAFRGGVSLKGVWRILETPSRRLQAPKTRLEALEAPAGPWRPLRPLRPACDGPVFVFLPFLAQAPAHRKPWTPRPPTLKNQPSRYLAFHGCYSSGKAGERPEST